MPDTILVLTSQEQEQLVHIRHTLDKLSSSLDKLPSHVKEHIKFEIEVFNREAEYMSDMLHSIAD